MNLHIQQPTLWRTASFGDAADTSPMEMHELGQHLRQCSQAHGRLFLLRCGVDALHQGLLGRFVTSLTVLVALVGATLLVL
jgi:hypothetical protein